MGRIPNDLPFYPALSAAPTAASSTFPSPPIPSSPAAAIPSLRLVRALSSVSSLDHPPSLTAARFKSGDFPSARKVFDGMPERARSFEARTAMVFALGAHGMAEEAVKHVHGGCVGEGGTRGGGGGDGRGDLGGVAGGVQVARDRLYGFKAELNNCTSAS